MQAFCGGADLSAPPYDYSSPEAYLEHNPATGGLKIVGSMRW